MSHYEIIQPRQRTRGLRFLESLRSLTLGPWNPKDREIARYFGGRPGLSGVSVDEDTSLGFAAVWNAMVLIAQDVAKVPLPLYRRLPDGGKELFRDHPLYELLHDEPNEEMSSYVFRRTLQGHVLVWGNGYAEIERDMAGRPAALWPLMPWSVQPVREGAMLRYRVKQPSGNDILFDRRDILHLSGIGQDGIAGYPPIRHAMESIGLGMATERFGAAFFGNGSTFGGIVSYPADLPTNEQVRKENREVIEKRHQGVDRSHRLLTLYGGAKYEQMGIPPDQAQFLETRRFQIEEVARWFNIPVHKLKELARSTNNNIEHQGIEYATDTLQPWFRMWEGELRLKLIPRLERKIQFFEHITEALTRGDSAAQGELVSKQFSVGAISPNEIRGKFNYNPRSDGNDIYVPSNTMPADLARQYWEAQIEKFKADTKAIASPPKTEPDLVMAQENKSLRDQLETARRLTQEVIDARDAALANLITERDAAQRKVAAIEAAASDAVQDLRTRLESAEQAANEARHDEHVAIVAADEAAATLVAAQAGLESARADAARFAAERDEQVAARVQDREVCQAESEKRQHAEQARDAAIEKWRLAEAEKDTLARDVVAMRATAVAFEEAAKEAERALLQARDDLQGAVVFAGEEYHRGLADGAIEPMRRADEYEAAAKSLMADLGSERDLRVAAQEAIVQRWEPRAEQAERERDTLAVEAETLRTDLARARADIAAEMERQQANKAVLLAAMRSLFVDATERLLTKESNAAQKHQATPEKLRTWMERFYPVHVETARAVFRPLVGPWTALTGGAPSALLERLVAEHVQSSQVALERVLESEDRDDMAANLDRLLRRWEDERAEAMADALVREGMGHGT